MSKQTLGYVYKLLSAELSEREARMIIKKRLNLDWSMIITDSTCEIETAEIYKDLHDRKAGKPLSRIYGHREFWGMEFDLNAHTLDPRPDSETLIEVALKHYKPQKNAPVTILDLGTGTGCLLLSLLSELPDAWGVGIDLSPQAAAMGQDNAQKLGFAQRSAFIVGNWVESINTKFDLIVSNPPYIESEVIPNLTCEVRNHDPILALDGGKTGLQDYDKIFSNLSRVLKKDGIALFEIGFDQSEKVTRLSEKYGLSCKGVHSDLSGNPRVVEIFL